MNRFGPAFLAVTVVGAFACQRDDERINQKLDDISKRLTAMEGKLGNAPSAGAAAARPPQRAAPDPTSVYAVPIGESASIGSKLAKVTIVEAFTFT
ncbi:MAG: hypothetical protein H0X17_05195 [Deltaproteobacteria bacterium]|nr:hypothetical protein [Deltaproteobacteria bacterium]